MCRLLRMLYLEIGYNNKKTMGFVVENVSNITKKCGICNVLYRICNFHYIHNLLKYFYPRGCFRAKQEEDYYGKTSHAGRQRFP